MRTTSETDLYGKVYEIDSFVTPWLKLLGQLMPW